MICANMIAFGKAAGGGLSAKSYIQTNALVRLDGLESAQADGNGNPMWMDLEGVANVPLPEDAYFTADGMGVAYKGVEFGGVGDNHTLIALQGAGEFTQECYIDYNSFPSALGAQGGILGFCPANYTITSVGMPWGVKYYIWSMGMASYAFNASSYLSKRKISIVSTISASQGVSRLYIDGALVKESEVDSDFVINMNVAYLCRFNRVYQVYVDESSTFGGLKGIYHRTTILKYALTPEEVAHNYEIDKARFGLS